MRLLFIREIVSARMVRSSLSLPLFEYYPIIPHELIPFPIKINPPFATCNSKRLTSACFLLLQWGLKWVLSFRCLRLLSPAAASHPIGTGSNEGRQQIGLPKHELQLDYIRCFLDMSPNCPNFTNSRLLVRKYANYPPNFTNSRLLVRKYANYPVESWRRLFDEVRATL